MVNAADDRSWEMQQQDIVAALPWLERAESNFRPGAWTRAWARRKLAGKHLRMEVRELEDLLLKADAALEGALRDYAAYDKELAREKMATKNLRKELARANSRKGDLERQFAAHRCDIRLDEGVAWWRQEAARLRGELLRAQPPGLSSYQIVKKDNEHLVAVIRKLTGENERLLEHIENLNSQCTS